MTDADRRLLSRYLDGECSPEEEARAVTLLAGEPEAGRELADLIRLDALLAGSAPVAVVRSRHLPLVMAAAAALLLAVGIWWWFGGSDEVDTPEPGPGPVVVVVDPPRDSGAPVPEPPIRSASRATFDPDASARDFPDRSGAEITRGTLRLTASEDGGPWRLEIPPIRTSLEATPDAEGFILVSPSRRDVAGGHVLVSLTIHLFEGELRSPDGDESRTISAPISVRRTVVIGGSVADEVAVEWGSSGPGGELDRSRYVMHVRFSGDEVPERYRPLSYPRLPAGPRLALTDLLDQARSLAPFPPLDRALIDGLRARGLLVDAIGVAASHREGVMAEIRVFDGKGAVLARGESEAVVAGVPEALRPRAARLVSFHRVPRPPRPERDLEIQSIPLDEGLLAELIGAPVRLPAAIRGKFIELARPISTTPEDLLLLLARKLHLTIAAGPDGYALRRK